jgi:hypothetical protein
MLVSLVFVYSVSNKLVALDLFILDFQLGKTDSTDSP